ncbi:MAG: histidine kinase N-terminal domain-containing protein [Acidimicrobiaceae bacterium]|nr:histidine kinase N-terminal domain-containing protein [Acidimicrobiaceae bacterium]MCY4293276.1 histidine kinase N-terminal domain-containing protein [Acidimicrobiaceae bacterium]
MTASSVETGHRVVRAMVGLGELAWGGTTLDERAIDHLHQLVAAWAPLADLSFGDLLLYAPCIDGFDPAAVDSAASAAAVGPDTVGSAADRAGGAGPDPVDGFVVLAHARANTGPTVHAVDPVGTVTRGQDAAWLSDALVTGEGGESEIFDTAAISELAAADDPGEGPRGDIVVQEEASIALCERRRVVDYVPVRCDGAPVAVLAREAAPAPVRHENPLETVYRDLYGRFAKMIAEGVFPYSRMERVGEFREPRVGDGVLVLDREGRVSYASPNARSALHRLGVMRPVQGHSLSDLGLDDTVIRRSFWRRFSTVAEFTAGSMIVVVMRSYPMVADDRITGAIAMLRDVSELRQHDRLLVSKDATIREIHHRVKNNLQTVSSLLQLQARRLDSNEAKIAVESSARRIASIAMVHEHLAIDTGADLNFDEVVEPLLRLVEKGLTTAERPLKIQVEGTVGEIDGETAMPLAVVLVELVQNAFQHATSPEGSKGLVKVRLDHSAATLSLSVTDDGPGVKDGFLLDRDAGLGLTIVRTFVVHDLGGSVTIKAASADPPCGTMIEVTVPRRSAAN